MKKKPKRYNSLHEIIASEEFEKFKERRQTTGYSLLDKIIKKKHLKIKTDIYENIVEIATLFYNSSDNEIE